MAKRLTDSTKFEKRWIRKLPCAYKLFWVYLLDKCDHAGVYDVDIELAEFQLNVELDESMVLECFKEQVVVFKKDKWFIPKFIDFQYGELKDTNKAHISVLKILTKYNLLEYLNQGATKPLIGTATQADKDKDMDKDMDKKKEKKKTRFEYPQQFEEFWSMYPRDKGKKPAYPKWQKALNETSHQSIMDSLEQHIKVEWKDTEQRFIPHAITWLNQARWNDRIEKPDKKIEVIKKSKFICPECDIVKVIEGQPKSNDLYCECGDDMLIPEYEYKIRKSKNNQPKKEHDVRPVDDMVSNLVDSFKM